MGSHNAVCSDEECIRALETAPTVREAAEKLGVHERTLLARRRRLERIYGITIRKLDDPRCNWPTWEHEHYRHDKDRKSTRLNSSHVKISYAVFCLKKKTKDHTMEELKPT